MIISKRAFFSLKTFWPAFCRTETMVRAVIGRSPAAWLFHTIEPRPFSHTSNLRNIRFVPSPATQLRNGRSTVGSLPSLLFIRALYFMAVSLFSSLSHCGFGLFPWSSVSSPHLGLPWKNCRRRGEEMTRKKWRLRARVFSAPRKRTKERSPPCSSMVQCKHALSLNSAHTSPKGGTRVLYTESRT